MDDLTGWYALQKFTRQFPTKTEGIILRNGLSPWSQVSLCDYCGSVKKYMTTNGIDHDAPLVQVGRWMLHEDCARVGKREQLSTLLLPRLNYAPLSSLPAPARIAIMKLQLQAQAEMETTALAPHAAPAKESHTEHGEE